MKYLSIIGLVCLTGCMGNMGLSSLSDSEVNIGNLTQISKGMTQREVYQIMRMPFEYETLCIGEDVYDIWFYTTSPTVLGQSRMVPQNLTPLAFKNGIFIGQGYNIYDALLRRKAGEGVKEEKPRHRENRSMEEALEISMSQKSEPPPPPMTRTLDERVPPDEQNPADRPAPSKKDSEKEEPFDKEGNRLNEDASEQDFDYW